MPIEPGANATEKVGQVDAGRPAPSGRPRRWWLAGAGLVLLVPLLVWLWRYPDRPGPTRPGAVTVDIPPGAGLLGIRKILVQTRVIDADPSFFLWAKLMGAARRLKAGEYAFVPGMSPRAVLVELAAGKTVRHAITIPEGSNIYQVADILKAGGWCRGEDFLKLASDAEFLHALGVPATSVEGYLFPDTYFFEKGAGLKAIVAVMARHMLRALAEEMARTAAAPNPAPGADGAGRASAPSGTAAPLTGYQVLTLASIVEKETALVRERPLVARVFLNRLRLGMKLQADPTVIYGARRFGAPLTKTDLDTPTPYNTYTNFGLPAGPICSPGLASIEAVLRPSPEDFYYFVSQNDGSHHFSKTLSEHNRAVLRYRERAAAGVGAAAPARSP